MSMREARPRRKQPAFMQTADAFYGSAFGPTNPKELARSIADWTEMTPEEQTFALAHLQWLNLQAQAEVWRQLGRACRLLEELAEGLDEDVAPEDADVDEPPPIEPEHAVVIDAPEASTDNVGEP